MDNSVKKSLMSFVYQVGSIEDRIKNDIFGKPIIKRKDFNKIKESIFFIKGIIIVSLSPIYKERTLFEIKAILRNNELIIKNIQSSKCQMPNIYSKDRDNETIEGEPLETTDSFVVRNKGDSNYLVHIIDDIVNTAYEVSPNYSIKDGFNESLKEVPIEDIKPKKPPKRHFKSLIKKYK